MSNHYYKSIVAIEPYGLWTIKTLKRFNIINNDEVAVLLEQYLESVSRSNARISVDTEKESDDYLVTLEPTKWKDQDHYLVLGLQHLRYKATEDDIRRAHRRKALKHHPDKRGQKKVDLDSDYYACITRAMDILGDKVKRRSYDSVDPTFDDTIPPKLKAKKLEQNQAIFYETFNPAFETNARWSIKPHVPYLGDSNSSQEYVENFYEFWYNFQSWREYSYLDEEDKEKGEDRYERRWLDKQNKAARQQRKKEEMQRIRQLVDNAYSCDPRISKFKEDAKRRKEEEKKAKQEEIRMRIAKEEAELAEQQRLKLEEEAKKEEEEKKRKLEEKRQRENAKKQAKKVLKSVEELFKANNYFVVDPNETVKHIEELDKLIKSLTLDDVVIFKKDIEASDNKRDVFLDRVNKLNIKIEEEKRQSIIQKSDNNNHDANEQSANASLPWSSDEIKLLVKAVSLFPAGTNNRWEVVADYMFDHSNKRRDSKQIVNKVKQIKDHLSQKKVYK